MSKIEAASGGAKTQSSGFENDDEKLSRIVKEKWQKQDSGFQDRGSQTIGSGSEISAQNNTSGYSASDELKALKALAYNGTHHSDRPIPVTFPKAEDAEKARAEQDNPPGTLFSRTRQKLLDAQMRILDAQRKGFKQGYGEGYVAVRSPEDIQRMKETGWYNDYGRNWTTKDYALSLPRQAYESADKISRAVIETAAAVPRFARGVFYGEINHATQVMAETGLWKQNTADQWANEFKAIPEAFGGSGSVVARGNRVVTIATAGRRTEAKVLSELDHLLGRKLDVSDSIIKSDAGAQTLGDSIRGVTLKGEKNIVRAGKKAPYKPMIKPEEISASKNLDEIAKDTAQKYGLEDKPVQPGWDATKANDPVYVKSYIDDLYKHSEVAQGELNDIADRITKTTGGVASPRIEPKKIDRVIEKVRESKGNASELVDLAGTKIVYNNLDELYKTIPTIEKELGGKIIRVKDRFINPAKSGYGDILMNVRLSNGHIGEFRLHLKEIDDIAKNIEHPLYQVRRSLEDLEIIENRNLTKTEKALDLEILHNTQKIYREAFEKIGR